MARPSLPSQAALKIVGRQIPNTPTPSSAAVSRRMREVRTADTQPEMRLRAILHRRGLRYRLGQHPVSYVRCSPDLVFPGPMVAVFVDGCFWHGCPDHPSWPRSNAQWWRQKIERNRARDASVTAALGQAGWLVLRIWEHQEPAEAADRIEAAVNQRRQRSRPRRLSQLLDTVRVQAERTISGVNRAMSTYPTAIDLFSGAGGLTLGLRWARFRVLGAVELDLLAAETYRTNFPGVHLWDMDVRQLSVARVLRELDLRPGQLDLLAGCPPCQGFSSLRSLNGHKQVDDDRNDLVLQFERFVRGLRPRAVMLENVPGLISDARLHRLARTLAELGYQVSTGVLDASRFGVPQRRKRMILVAGRRRPIPLAPEEEPTKTVWDAIGSLPPVGNSGDPLHDLPEIRQPRIRELIARIPQDGGSRSDLGAEGQLGCHRRCDGFYDVYGRMAWREVAPTITSGCINPSKGRFLHPQEDRAITLREAALLQGFPPDYHFSLRRGKYSAAEMIGNALPPGFVKAHAAEIRRILVGR